ncbi:MAG TPA: DNA mismatch repair protein MutS, partial [Candidatus Omnitrophota bacterium]|nr:DNA mismatch repair protein MutS [Candidatus Omnitrophota bacterium]
ETANILNSATERSLIVLDEVGRGTSTFDGVSIAWAVVEYIHGELKGAKAMFATHYHELTELSEVMRGVINYHLAVQEWEDQIIFLYKVQKGSCDESFGIHVAKLAGLPEAVVKRAREILANLHRDSFAGNVRSRFIEKIPGSEKQLDFFGEKSLSSGIAERIMDMDTDRMTPMEALQAIAEIKKELSSGATAQKITGDKK